MGGIKQIFNKEMARIFKDKKMVFSVFFLPVVIMIVILTLVNGLASNMKNDIASHVSKVYIANKPQGFEEVLKASGIQVQVSDIGSEAEMKQAKKEILDGEADLIVEFPQNLLADIEGYQQGSVIPQVKTYQNPSEDYSNAAFENMNQAIEAYRQTLLAQRVGDLSRLMVFQVNSDNEEMYIQDEQKAGGKAVGMMLPYFITILLFAGAMGIGTDMIAGEKERGTMASLLVSPVKRSAIALGKVFSLMVVSGISSLIYVGAMVVCAPIMMNSMGGQSELNISLNVQQIVMLGVLLVLIAFLYSSIIALISVFAKSTKEANTYVMPAYMLVLVVGLFTMFDSGNSGQWSYYIPFYNNALVLKGILSQEVTMLQYGVTVVETLALGVILLGVIVKAFESEKVMSA